MGKTLEEAGLVNVVSSGREQYCHLQLKPLNLVDQWLKRYEKFWNSKLDDVGDYLDRQK